MRCLPDTPEVTAAALSAMFAREIGLPPGNLWEPPTARHIANDLRRHSAAQVEDFWRRQLGLPRREISPAA